MNWLDFDLDSGALTFGAGSRFEMSDAIRILGQKYSIPASGGRKLGTTNSANLFVEYADFFLLTLNTLMGFIRGTSPTNKHQSANASTF